MIGIGVAVPLLIVGVAVGVWLGKTKIGEVGLDVMVGVRSSGAWPELSGVDVLVAAGVAVAVAVGSVVLVGVGLAVTVGVEDGVGVSVGRGVGVTISAADSLSSIWSR